MGGVLGMAQWAGGTAIKGQVFDKMKSQSETFVPLIMQSFQQNFKPTKIEVLPIETAGSSKSYQEAKYESAVKSHLPGGMGFGTALEYASYDQWRIPAAGLKFLMGGEPPKKLFPLLHSEAGVDGVMWIQLNLLRHSNDDLRLGDCLLEIYAINKSGKEDVVAFSINLKNAGEGSKLGLKKEEWKDKESKDKKIEEYWPILAKIFENLFQSYAFLIDQGIK